MDIATLGIKIDSTAAKTAGTDLDALEGKARKVETATQSMTSSFSKLQGVVVALAGSFALLKMAQYIQDATLAAARYETLGVVMRVVGNNARYTGAQMEVFAKGLEKTGISMNEARQSLTRMVQAQLDLNQSSKLARVAQDAAVIGNINSSEAFQRLVYGIQSGQVEMLRTIGINVNFENSYQKVAAATRRVVSSFTESEKAQIRMSAAMEAGARIAGTYEAAMDTAGKQLMSLPRHLENLKVLFGLAFTPALAEIIEMITGALVDLNGELSGDGKRKIEDWGNAFRLTIMSIQAEIMRLAMFIDKVGGTLTSAQMLLYGPGTALGIESSTKRFEAAAQANIELEKRYKETEKALEALAKKYIELEQAMTPAGKAAAKFAADELERKRMAAAVSEPATKVIDFEAERRKKEALKQITEATRQAAYELDAIGKTQYEQDLIRLAEQVDKYREAGVDKVTIAKFVAAETLTIEAKAAEETKKILEKNADELAKSWGIYYDQQAADRKEEDAAFQKYEADKIAAIEKEIEAWIKAGEAAVDAMERAIAAGVRATEASLRAYRTYMKMMAEERVYGDPLAQLRKEEAEKIFILEAAFDKKLISERQYLKDRETINRNTNDKIQKMEDKIKQMQIASVKNVVSGFGEMLDAAQTMYDKDSSEYKRLAEAKKAIQIAELAMTAAKNVQIIASNMATVASNTGVAVSNAGTAITGAAIGVGPTGFVTAAAMIALLASVFAAYGIAAGGSVGGGATAIPKAATTVAGSTVLGGEAGAASESLDNIMKILEEAHAEEYNELKGIRDEIEQLNRNITGLVSSLVRGYGDFRTSFEVPGENLSEEIKNIRFISDNILLGYVKWTKSVFGDDSPISKMVDYFKYLDPIAGTFSLLAKGWETLFGGKITSVLTQAGITLDPASIRALSDGIVTVAGRAFGIITTTTSGGWFGKDSTSITRVEKPLEDRVNRFFISIYESLGKTAIGLAKIFGTDMEKVLSYMFPKIDINLLGLSAEEADKKLRSWISETGDVMAKALFDELISKYQKINEGLLETAVRVAIELVVVRDMMKMIGMEVKGSTAYLIEWTQAMVEASGDLENFQKNVGLFFEKFFSQAEQQAAKLDFLNIGLMQFGVQLPATRDAFRSIVQAIDTTTEAGQEFFGFLMSIIGMVDSFYAYSEQVFSDFVNAQIKIMELLGQKSKALAMSRKFELDAMDESLWAIQKATWMMEDAIEGLAIARTNLENAFKAEKERINEALRIETDRLNESLKETTNIVAELRQAFNRLTSARESMRLIDAAYETTRYKNAQIALFELLGQVRGGDFSGLKEIDQTLADLTKSNVDQYTNSVDYKRNYWKTYNAIAEIENLTGDQLSISETIATGIEEQIASAKENAERQISVLDAQLQILLEINTSVLSVEDAIAGYNVAKAAMTEAQAYAQAVAAAPYQEPAWTPPAVTTPPPAPPKPITAEEYAAANPDLASFYAAWKSTPQGQPGDTFAGQFYSGQDLATFLNLHGATYGYRAANRGFAEGGISFGPESGYGARLHGTELIVSPNASYPATVKGGDNVIMIDELRKLRAETKDMKVHLYQITKNTGKSARADDLIEQGLATNGLLTRTA